MVVVLSKSANSSYHGSMCIRNDKMQPKLCLLQSMCVLVSFSKVECLISPHNTKIQHGILNGKSQFANSGFRRVYVHVCVYALYAWMCLHMCTCVNAYGMLGCVLRVTNTSCEWWIYFHDVSKTMANAWLMHGDCWPEPSTVHVEIWRKKILGMTIFFKLLLTENILEELSYKNSIAYLWRIFAHVHKYLCTDIEHTWCTHTVHIHLFDVQPCVGGLHACAHAQIHACEALYSPCWCGKGKNHDENVLYESRHQLARMYWRNRMCCWHTAVLYAAAAGWVTNFESPEAIGWRRESEHPGCCLAKGKHSTGHLHACLYASITCQVVHTEFTTSWPYAS